jgi:hypothetical protein
VPIIRTLPAPTWTGVPDDIVQKFATFMATDAQRRAQLIPDELRDELRVAEHHLSRYREHKSNLDQDIKPLRTKERRLLKQLNGRTSKTDDYLKEQIELIYALPFVIGSRVDQTGRLVVQMRLQVTELGKLRDMGDFELTFDGTSSGGGRQWNSPQDWKYRLGIIRLTTNYWWNIKGINDPYEERDNVTGGFTLWQRSAKNYISSWDFVGLAQNVHDFLVTQNTPDESDFDAEDLLNEDYAVFPVLIGTPDSVWDGFVPNPLKALHRSIELHDGTIEYELSRVREDLKDIVYELELAKANVREWDAKVRIARAAYEANRTDDARQIVIQFEDVVETIASIMRLPGVMGMRFDETGWPVVHVRSSFDYFGKRFDAGDFELTFMEDQQAPGQGGIRTFETRSGAMLRGHTARSYYHPNGRASWFCYGDRSNELQRLLRDGHYVEMVHLAINTLNGLNPGDQNEDVIAQYYARIPRNLVWRSDVRIEPVAPVEEAA